MASTDNEPVPRDKPSAVAARLIHEQGGRLAARLALRELRAAESRRDTEAEQHWHDVLIAMTEGVEL